jgi:hypothetical protein
MSGTGIKTSHTTRKVIPTLKRNKQRVFGDYRFDFIKQCKHENSVQCPFCKLVSLATRQYFVDEAESRRLAKEQSLLRRAEMRLGLLMSWAANQSCLYSDLIENHCLEILLSRRLSEAIVVRNNDENSSRKPIDLGDIIRILDRRNRIVEVGHFAAIFLQCRIRKYISNQKLKRNLLQRFEMVPATRRKQEYFFDPVKHKRWTRLPLVLKSERPGTPRTIQRRLNMWGRARDERMQRYRISSRSTTSGAAASMVASSSSGSKGDEMFFENEDEQVMLLRQLVVLRDLLAIGFKKLLRQIALSKMEPASSSASSVDSAAVAANLNSRAARAARQAPPQKEQQLQVVLPVAVRVSLTAPALPTRQLGIAAALETEPLDASSDPNLAALNAMSMLGVGDDIRRSISQVSPELMASSATRKGSIITSPVPSLMPQASRKGSLSADTTTKQKYGKLNRAMQVLEQRAYTALCCETPEAAVKLLLLEDVAPILESVANISSDEFSIWNCTSSFRLSDVSTISGGLKASAIIENAKPITPSPSFDKQYGLNSGSDILPLSIQIRPAFPDRVPHGIFRLFFYDMELIAVCQASPWAFYPEVGTIVGSINDILDSGLIVFMDCSSCRYGKIKTLFLHQ